jgi:hypothetical protein
VQRLGDLEAMVELANEKGGESMVDELARETAAILIDLSRSEIAALLSG